MAANSSAILSTAYKLLSLFFHQYLWSLLVKTRPIERLIDGSVKKKKRLRRTLGSWGILRCRGAQFKKFSTFLMRRSSVFICWGYRWGGGSRGGDPVTSADTSDRGGGGGGDRHSAEMSSLWSVQSHGRAANAQVALVSGSGWTVAPQGVVFIFIPLRRCATATADYNPCRVRKQHRKQSVCVWPACVCVLLSNKAGNTTKVGTVRLCVCVHVCVCIRLYVFPCM